MLASSSSKQLVPRRVGAVAALLAGLAGCTEPAIDRPGTWQPTGANEHNLRAMLVNPQDAYVGTGVDTARGDSGARAVTRLLTDRRRALLDAAASKVAPSGGSAGDSGGGAAPASSGPTGSSQ